MQPYRSIEDVFAAGQRAIAEKATDKKLAEYLDAFTQGRLTTGKPEGVPSYEVQRDRMVAVMRKHYADGYGYHQTVRNADIDVPKFFELVLSLAFVAHDIELVSIGYDDCEIFPGLRRPKVPYAEFVITSDTLKQEVAAPDKIATPTAPPDIVPARPDNAAAKQEGRVIKDGRLILITITGDKTYIVARLEKDGSYDRFMDYVLDAENADIDISIEDINALKGTLLSVKDLTELIRHSGFNKQLKLAFFPTSNWDKIRFTPVAMLNDRQVKAVKKQAEKVKAKNRK